MAILHFENGIVVHPDDSFFLDTNAIVSFLCEEDPHHLASIVYISYLLLRQARVYINEVVVMEAINTMARTHYVHDVYHDYVTQHGPVENPEVMRREIRSGWYANIVKKDDQRLSHFNKLACEDILLFLDFCRLSSATRETIMQGLANSYGIPLASADALIAAAAEKHNAALISFDRDLDKLPDATIYKTTLRNDFFRPLARSIIESLDPHLPFFLQSLLGKERYELKFPTRLSSKKGTLI